MTPEDLKKLSEVLGLMIKLAQGGMQLGQNLAKIVSEMAQVNATSHVVKNEYKPYHVYPPEHHFRKEKIHMDVAYQGGVHKLGKPSFFHRLSNKAYVDENKRLKECHQAREKRQDESNKKSHGL